jgi:hypothetical protein
MAEKDNKLTEILKKVASVGISSALLTEEGVKNLLQDLPLPKELIQGLVNNAKGAKEDFLHSVRAELAKYFNDAKASEIIEEILSRNDLEINATIKLKPKVKTKKQND